MNVDIALSNARIYSISRIDVVKGEKFSLFTDNTGISQWFSDNDQVLALSVKGQNADVEAMAVGNSTLLIMGEGRAILKELAITVLDAIEPRATSLGLTADTPVKQ